MTLYLQPCPVAGCNRVGIIGDAATRLCWRHANEAAGIVIPAAAPRPKRPWTTPEEDRLRDLWASGMRAADIGRVLGGRSDESVQKHAKVLGLDRRPTNPRRSK